MHRMTLNFKIVCILSLIVFFQFIPSLIIADCWDIAEISEIEFAEIDDTIIFSFKDAVTCSALKNARIDFLGQIFQTNTKGYLTLPLSNFSSMKDNVLPLTAQKDGYCSFTKDIKVEVGTVFEKRFLMTKELPIDNVRFILQWGVSPKDLDLHLVGKNFHISYRDMKFASQKAKLDRDDVDRYGPETITMDKVVTSETYAVYVHNFSAESNIPSDVQVSVYKNNQLDRVLSLPSTTQQAIKVLEIKNNQILYHNNEVTLIPKHL